MACRLCLHETQPIRAGGRDYASCLSCGYVGLDPAFFLEPDAEKARYRLHKNSPSDPGYRAFIDAFLDAALGFVRPGSEILDFGSGPEPAPAVALAERGYKVSIWDPFFAPQLDWEARDWDYVLVHEVAEHLRDPAETLGRLARRLKAGGAMLVRTRFPPLDMRDFERWPYRLDPTHVGFFSERSAAWLASEMGLSPMLLERPDRIVLAKGP